MKRPLIGLTGSRMHGGDLVRNLDVLASSPIDVFYADYSQSVIAAGGLPVFLPLDVDPAHVIERLDGVLITGGDDIDPVRYGAERSEHTQPSESTRDAQELALLDAAVDATTPVLGICRGIQIVNVHAGGTLRQHVPEHAFLQEAGSVEQHDVLVEPGSVLAGLYGERHSVNSLHHQSVDRVGAGLRVTCRSDDGGVEGLEYESLPIVAVQWHPEMLSTAATDPIFRWLVDAATAAGSTSSTQR